MISYCVLIGEGKETHSHGPPLSHYQFSYRHPIT